MKLRKLHEALGVEVSGVDPASLDDGAFATLRAALAEHSVLLFRGLAIDDDAQIALSRRFGAIEDFPLPANKSSLRPEIFRATNVGEDGRLLPVEHSEAKYLSLTRIWHTDSSWRPIPAYVTLLRAVETPTRGGETMFASLAAAWEALPAERQAALRGLIAAHSFEYTRGLTAGLAPLTEAQRAAVAPVRHPLVRRHPETGRTALYISPHTMPAIEGMDDGEGRALIEELTAWATQPRFVYVHAWRPGDLLLWDNRTTMHAVRPYADDRERRVMHRTSVAGDGPVLAA